MNWDEFLAERKSTPDALDGTQLVPEEPKATSWDAFLLERKASETGQLKSTMDMFQGASPERMRRLFRLQRDTGLPMEVLDTDLDGFERTAKEQPEKDWAEFSLRSPLVAEWMKQPENGGLVRDETATWGLMEWLFGRWQVKEVEQEPGVAGLLGQSLGPFFGGKFPRQVEKGAVQKAWEGGEAMYELAKRSRAALDRGVDISSDPYLEDLSRRMNPELGQERSFIRRSVYELVKNLPQRFHPLPGSVAAGGIAFQATMAATPTAPHPLALSAKLATATSAATAAATTEYWRNSFDIEGGLSYYDNLKEQRRVHGYVDIGRAQMAATLAGAFNATLETGSDVVLAGFAGPLKKLFPSSSKLLPKRQGVMGALGRIGTSVAVPTASEGITEFSQGAISEIAKQYAAGENLELDLIVEQASAEAEAALYATWMLAIPGAAGNARASIRSHQMSVQRAQAIHEMVERARGSKLYQTAPEKAGELLGELNKKNAGDSNVYLDPKVWYQLWGTQENAERAAVELFGSAKPLQEAVAHGAEMAIPLDVYIAKLSDPSIHEKLFLDLRPGFGLRTTREMIEAHDKVFEVAQAELKQDPSKLFEDASAKKLFDILYKQAYATQYEVLKGQGVGHTEARKRAKKQANADTLMTTLMMKVLAQSYSELNPEQQVGAYEYVTEVMGWQLDIGVHGKEMPEAQGLTLEQQVEALRSTPEVMEYFAGTVLADETGAPVVAYHGTTAIPDSMAADVSGQMNRRIAREQGNIKEDFGAFDTTREHNDLGTHFTLNPNVAEAFAGRGRSPKGRVFPVFLRIKNPIRLKDAGEWKWTGDNLLVSPKFTIRQQLLDLGVITEEEATRLDALQGPSFLGETLQEALFELLESKGYDGIVYQNRREIPDIEGNVIGPTYDDASVWERVAERSGKKQDGTTLADLAYLSDEDFLEFYPEAEDSYIIFRPEQAKSVWNLKPTTDPRLLKQQAEERVGLGAGQGVVRDVESGLPVFSVDEAVSGIAASQEGRGFLLHQGVETPHKGRYLRGSSKTAVKGKPAEAAVDVLARSLSNDVLIPEDEDGNIVDQWSSVEEAAAWAKEAEYVSPDVRDSYNGKPKKLRWSSKSKKAQDGLPIYGNAKMQFPNYAYPHGRNTWEDSGCGRLAWIDANKQILRAACYLNFGKKGAACYAETLIKTYQGGVASVAEGITVRGLAGPERGEVLDYIDKHGIDAAKKKYEDVVFKEKDDGGWSLSRVAKSDKPPAAVVYTNLEDAKGQDIRLGVDTDGAAWLADERVLDAILGANPRTVSVYSSGYYTPPPKHPLSGRTIINVTVSGWHPLGETMSRLRWAEAARANGWNVILREVTADPVEFNRVDPGRGDKLARRYNRLHEALLKTDFFIMQQPLHEGRVHGKELWGLPGCCIGSAKNENTCDQCEVSEGLGKRFQKYWEIAEEGTREEQILPDVKDYRGVQLTEPSTGSGAALRLTQTATPPVQEVTSEGTANKGQIPSSFKSIPWKFGGVNLDIGGGPSENASGYLAERGVTNLVFDPFNRSSEHNQRVLSALERGSVDTVTAANVLNVIAEKDVRLNVIHQASRALRLDGTAYFQIYNSGKAGLTSRGYQNGLPASAYVDEVRTHFGDVKVKGDLIIARDPKITGPAYWQTARDVPFTLLQSAWHGTPHDFESFDIGKIGTGEGAASYGWGLYFTKSKSIADRYYRERLVRNRVGRGQHGRSNLYTIVVGKKTVRMGELGDVLIDARDDAFQLFAKESVKSGLQYAIDDIVENASSAANANNLQAEFEYWRQQKIGNFVGRVRGLRELIAWARKNKYRDNDLLSKRSGYHGDDISDLSGDARIWLHSNYQLSYYVELLQKEQTILEELSKLDMSRVEKPVEPTGQLFEVDLPDMQELMDWESALEDQPAVLDRLVAAGILERFEGKYYLFGVEFYPENMNGEDLAHQIDRLKESYGRTRLGGIAIGGTDSTKYFEAMMAQDVRDLIEQAHKADRKAAREAHKTHSKVAAKILTEALREEMTREELTSDVLKSPDGSISLSERNKERLAKVLDNRAGFIVALHKGLAENYPEVAPKYPGVTNWGAVDHFIRVGIAGLQYRNVHGENARVTMGGNDKVKQLVKKIADEAGLTGDVKKWEPGELASRLFWAAGIPGHHYVGDSSGVTNFVMYHQDAVRVLKKYYQEDDEVLGYIEQFSDKRFAIRLMRNSNASTMVHEIGHFMMEAMGQAVEAGHANERVAATYAAILKMIDVKDRAELKSRADEAQKIAATANLERRNLTDEERAKIAELTKPFEVFARTWEAYLMKGEPPVSDPEVVKAFAQYRVWLMQVYRGLPPPLAEEVGGEVKAIFDRMIAGDEAVVNAEAAARMQAIEELREHMTSAEWSEYQEMVEYARAIAQDRMRDQMLQPVRGEISEWLRGVVQKVRGEVEDELRKDRTHQLRWFLTRHRMIDGSEIPSTMTTKTPSGETVGAKLSKDDLLRSYSKDFVEKGLPRGSYTRKGGIDPELASAYFGFSSVDEMVNALSKSERFEDAVDAEVGRRIDLLLPPDLLDDAKKATEAALDASTGPERADVLIGELNAFHRWMKKKGIDAFGKVTKEDAEAWAASLISAIPIFQLRPSVYLSKANQHAKAAAFAAGAKDPEKAAQEKTNQIFWMTAYRHARDARALADSKERMLKYWSSDVGRARLGKLDPPNEEGRTLGFLDQVDAILARVGFTKMSGVAIQRRQRLEDWVREMNLRGMDPVISKELIDEAYAKNYREMTVEEFQGLVDTVESITYLAKKKEELLDGKRKREWGEAMLQLASTAQENTKSTPPSEFDPNRMSQARLRWEMALAFDASLKKIEELVRRLDGGRADGPFSQMLWAPIVKAQNDYNDLMLKVNKRIIEALDRRRAAGAAQAWEEKYVDSLGITVTREWLLALAMNYGNDSNWTKTVSGVPKHRGIDASKWTAENLEAALDLLEEADWDFVQETWNTLESLWPAMEAMERRLTGIAPPKVERRAFEKFGKRYEGGYYPVVYDPRQGQFAGTIKLDEAEDIQTLFRHNMSRAMTAHGHLNRRVEKYAEPIFLTLDVLPAHLQTAVHDLTHREAVIQAHRILTDKTLRPVLVEGLGMAHVRAMDFWVRNIASGGAMEETGNMAKIARPLRATRRNLGMAYLGFKVTTAIQNYLNVIPAWDYFKQRGFNSTTLMKCLTEFSANRDAWYKEIDSLSGEMRHRVNNIERDVRENLHRILGKKGVSAKMQGQAYALIATTDAHIAYPMWMAIYREMISRAHIEEIAKNVREDLTKEIRESKKDATYAPSEQELRDAYIEKTEKVYARDEADRGVRLALGAGGLKDLSEIQSKNELTKQLTMFFSFMNTMYNRTASLHHDAVMAREAGVLWKPGTLANLGIRLFAQLVAFNLLSEAIVGRGPDDDEEWWKWAMRKSATYPIQMLPGIRDIASFNEFGRSGRGLTIGVFADTFWKSTKYQLDVVTGDKSFDAQEYFSKTTAAAADVAGVTMGFPAGQAKLVTSYTWDLMYDDADATDAWRLIWRERER